MKPLLASVTLFFLSGVFAFYSQVDQNPISFWYGAMSIVTGIFGTVSLFLTIIKLMIK